MKLQKRSVEAVLSLIGSLQGTAWKLVEIYDVTKIDEERSFDEVIAILHGQHHSRCSEFILAFWFSWDPRWVLPNPFLPCWLCATHSGFSISHVPLIVQSCGGHFLSYPQKGGCFEARSITKDFVCFALRFELNKGFVQLVPTTVRYQLILVAEQFAPGLHCATPPTPSSPTSTSTPTFLLSSLIASTCASSTSQQPWWPKVWLVLHWFCHVEHQFLAWTPTSRRTHTYQCLMETLVHISNGVRESAYIIWRWNCKSVQ